MRHKALLLFGLCTFSLCAADQVEDEIARIDPELSAIKRSDSLPKENLENVSDTYLEGYIQALIDAHYYEYHVKVTVEDHAVYLSSLPKNELIARSIISFVQDIPGVKSVEVQESPKQQTPGIPKNEIGPRVSGVWFPQMTVLFAPLIGDPREPEYSANYRFGDRIMGRKAVAVSLGDDFPIFRWRHVFRWHGDLQIGIQAGVWAVFNFSHVPNRKQNTCELMNTDYLVGIPLTYAFDKWSFRLRVYHISSHLGDEFLVDHPWFLEERKNPSFEALEWISAYQLSSGLRVYGGPGWVFHSDDTFKIKPLYVKWGSEIRLFGQKLYYHQLYGTPFLVIHLENWEQKHWNLDQFYKIGYEISKLQGIGRKMRLYLEYHQGYSYEGQFFNYRVRYGQVGFSWGF
jgi:hypothetical protein